MEEGELSEDDNLSCETVSSVGSVYSHEDPNSVSYNDSKSLEGSTVSNVVLKNLDPIPTNSKFETFKKTMCTKDYMGTTIISEKSNKSIIELNGKHYTSKSGKGEKQFINTRATYFTDKSRCRSDLKAPVSGNSSHTERKSFLKRKHPRDNSNTLVDENHTRRKKKKRRRNKHDHDISIHYRSTLNLNSGEFSHARRSTDKFKNKHGGKNKRNSNPNIKDDLLYRVISKSGPSQVKDLSNPLVGGCEESSLLKKLFGSGNLITKPTSVSSDLKCEIGSIASISSPDMEMFEDLHMGSSDLDPQEIRLSEPEIIDLEEHLSDEANYHQDLKTSTNDNSDSDIEVIIPEKKLPPLVVLYSDGEEEEIENSVQQQVVDNANQTVIPLKICRNDNSRKEIGEEINSENIIENAGTVEDSINIIYDTEDNEQVQGIQSIDVTNSECSSELHDDDNDDDDDDDDILKLRLIALKSSKDKPRLNNNEIFSESKSQSECSMTDRNLEGSLSGGIINEDEEDLQLRAEALKSAFLRKHNKRLKKRIQTKDQEKKINDKRRHSSISSVYSPSNITSPLSPTSSYELSLQGEEDMEIVESDIEGLIVEEVNNLCESDTVNEANRYNSSTKCTELSMRREYPNIFINNNYSKTPGNGLYKEMLSAQEYNNFKLSKDSLEYAQPLPPGVDVVASSNLSLNEFCSSQFPSKQLTPPPPPSILSLLPPPPPPPLPPMSQSLIKNDRFIINTNTNVTDFVQSGNEFSVHHSFPVLNQNNNNFQCAPLNSQFYTNAFQTPENRTDSDESIPPTPKCSSSQNNFVVNPNAHISNEENLPPNYVGSDSNTDICQGSFINNPAQISFYEKCGNTTVGSRQNRNSRPNLLQVPINKNNYMNLDLKNTNTALLLTGNTQTDKQNSLGITNNKEKLVGKNCEIPFEIQNIRNNEATNNTNSSTAVNNVIISTTGTNNTKISNKALIRREKKRRRKIKRKELSQTILKTYFKSSSLKGNFNKLKVDEEPGLGNDIVNVEIKKSGSDLNSTKSSLEGNFNKLKVDELSSGSNIVNTEIRKSMLDVNSTKSSLEGKLNKLKVVEQPSPGSSMVNAESRKSVSIVNNTGKQGKDNEQVGNLVDENSFIQAMCTHDNVKENPAVFDSQEKRVSISENCDYNVEKEENQDMPFLETETAKSFCTPKEIPKFVSHENNNASRNVENNQENYMDLSEMIILDEVGMSPERKSKDNNDEIRGSEINYSSNGGGDDDDVETLRAKALTSITPKVVDIPKSSTNTKKSYNIHVRQSKLQRDYSEDNVSLNKSLLFTNEKNVVGNNLSNKMSELEEKSRYRISRVANRESVRSVVKGKSLKVVIPSDVSIMSKTNISTMAQVSPPQVPRMVINVGQDSDSDEDPHNECEEWSRRVTIRDSENKITNQEGIGAQVDIEKSVEMFLSNVRKQHENALHNSKLVEFNESIERVKDQELVSFEKPVEKNISAVTEFNVTGISPLTAPLKRISTTNETPVRLLPFSKQEEYRKLKRELADMQKLRQQLKKPILGLPATSKLKVYNPQLKHAVMNESGKKITTSLKNNHLNKEILPVEVTGAPVSEQPNTSLEYVVRPAERVPVVNTATSNVPFTETIKSSEIPRVETLEEDLDKAEKELLNERYGVIDELTEMSNLLGDFERAQEKLSSNVSEVIRLWKELRAAESKFEEQKNIVMSIQNNFFSTHAKMMSGRLSCEQWEKTCLKLGFKVNGPNYKILNNGKQLLVKKLQQVSERTKKLKINERTPNLKANTSTNNYKFHLTPELQSLVIDADMECNDVLESGRTNLSDSSESYLNVCNEGAKIPSDCEEVRSQCDNLSLINQTILYNSDISLFSSNESESNEITPLAKKDDLISFEPISETHEESVNSESALPIIEATVSDGLGNNPNILPQPLVSSESGIRTEDSSAMAVKQINSQNRILSYRSPLQHFGIESGKSFKAGNPQAILCQFDLMGKCLDDSCPFTHHTKSS